MTEPGPLDPPGSDEDAYLHLTHRIGDALLAALDDACEQLGITYVVYAGTLLGVRRHGGWIPWDDDVDVAMTRADLEVLRARGAEVLPPNIRYSDLVSDPRHVTKIPRLLHLDTEWSARGSAERAEHPDGRHVGLDIFVLDRAPRSAWGHRLWRRLIRITLQLAVARRWKRVGRLEGGASLPRRAYRALVLGAAHLLPERTWLRAYDGVCGWFNRRGRGRPFSGTNHGKPAFGRLRIDEADLFPTVEGRFGDLTVRCPARSDRILQLMYGPAYMTPPAEHQRAPLHQRTWLRARLDGTTHTCGRDPAS